jgi:hypothetical protein
VALDATSRWVHLRGCSGAPSSLRPHAESACGDRDAATVNCSDLGLVNDFLLSLSLTLRSKRVALLEEEIAFGCCDIFFISSRVE